MVNEPCKTFPSHLEICRPHIYRTQTSTKTPPNPSLGCSKCAAQQKRLAVKYVNPSVQVLFLTFTGRCCRDGCGRSCPLWASESEGVFVQPCPLVHVNPSAMKSRARLGLDLSGETGAGGSSGRGGSPALFAPTGRPVVTLQGSSEKT